MQLAKNIKTSFEPKSFFKDGWLLGLSIFIAATNIFLLGWAITHIRRVNIEIPIRFSSLSNFDQLGAWYRLYEIPAMTLLICVTNLFLAILLHKKNRILSIFLCIVAVMVAVLASAILLGFTVIKYGTI